ncbi:MAG: hypothetical protein K6G10_04265 [Butyrivibrio sp.]|nr:hypothetical protein [Butyrivibrio sp.]
MAITIMILGCGKSNEDASKAVEFETVEKAETEQTQENTGKEPIEKTEPGLAETEDVSEVQFLEPEETMQDSGIDVDLTLLSSTMVYSEVYNMMIMPDSYKGKVIKMKGQYVPYFDEATGKRYFCCFISDATACCSQGIEFILTDDYSYPEDYPQEGDDICVIGTFDTYMEDNNMYCTLRDASLSV